MRRPSTMERHAGRRQTQSRQPSVGSVDSVSRTAQSDPGGKGSLSRRDEKL